MGGLAAYGWRMAVPRGGGNPRGTRAPGAASKPPQARPELAEPEQVADPHAPRGIIDYTLQRRAALGSLVLVATGASDHLDPTRTYCGPRAITVFQPRTPPVVQVER